MTRSTKSAGPTTPRNAQVLLDVLGGEQRAAGRDLTDERQEVALARGSLRCSALASRELERTRLRGVAAKQTGALEIREVRVHGRRRCEPDGLADLAHGRWIAVLVDVSDDVVPDLLLPGGQHTGSSL